MSKIALAIVMLTMIMPSMVRPCRSATPTQQLEESILNGMREEIDLTHEIYLEIGLVPILVTAGELAE